MGRKMKIPRQKRKNNKKIDEINKITPKPGECPRCGLETNHLLPLVCESCLDVNPKLTVEEKEWANIWDSRSMLELILQLSDPKFNWHWSRNWNCKYLDVRIDMRDGGCLVYAKGERIGPDGLAWQQRKAKDMMAMIIILIILQFCFTSGALIIMS